MASPSTGYCMVKAKKGVIKVRIAVEGGKVVAASVSGDFFMYPEEALWELEKVLENSEAAEESLRSRIVKLFEERGVKLAGSRVEDFVDAVLCALRDAVGGGGSA